MFAVCMTGTTLPTPLYGLYQEKFSFSELTVTVVYAVYAFAVIGVLLLPATPRTRWAGGRCC